MTNKQTSKQTLTKKIRSRRHNVETIVNADYADDLVLILNTLAQAESLLHIMI